MLASNWLHTSAATHCTTVCNPDGRCTVTYNLDGCCIWYVFNPIYMELKMFGCICMEGRTDIWTNRLHVAWGSLRLAPTRIERCRDIRMSKSRETR